MSLSVLLVGYAFGAAATYALAPVLWRTRRDYVAAHPRTSMASVDYNIFLALLMVTWPVTLTLVALATPLHALHKKLERGADLKRLGLPPEPPPPELERGYRDERCPECGRR